MKDLKNIKYWLFDLDNTLFFNDEVAAWNGRQFTGKAKFKTLQIGLSFHSTNYKNSN